MSSPTLRARAGCVSVRPSYSPLWGSHLHFRSGECVPSWQELVDPFVWMVRQAREGIREPSLRIDVAVSIRALRAALPVVLAHTPRARSYAGMGDDVGQAAW